MRIKLSTRSLESKEAKLICMMLQSAKGSKGKNTDLENELAKAAMLDELGDDDAEDDDDKNDEKDSSSESG